LQFLVIWRLFRGASLLDGVAPPENMTRCVCNNYDVEGFWKGWHCSYNRWVWIPKVLRA
jgi:D-alanyl-lipoteichoic acid acyltransferase DltB (MBOAT superfamily)